MLQRASKTPSTENCQLDNSARVLLGPGPVGSIIGSAVSPGHVSGDPVIKSLSYPQSNILGAAADGYPASGDHQIRPPSSLQLHPSTSHPEAVLREKEASLAGANALQAPDKCRAGRTRRTRVLCREGPQDRSAFRCPVGWLVLRGRVQPRTRSGSESMTPA